MLVFGLEIGVGAGCDEGWHVERLADIGPAASYEALTFPLAGLTGDRREAGKRRSLFVLQGSQLGHGRDELVGGEWAKAADACDYFMAPGEQCIGGNDTGDLGIEGCVMAFDLGETLSALAFEDCDGQVLLAVLERGAIADQPIASVYQLGQLQLLRASGWSDGWLERGSHSGQQHGVDPVGLGQSAGGLGKSVWPIRG